MAAVAMILEGEVRSEGAFTSENAVRAVILMWSIAESELLVSGAGEQGKKGGGYI
jgi:hypothetical protein